MFVTLTIAVVVGIAWRVLDHLVHPDAVAAVPIEYESRLERKVLYTVTIIAPFIEEPLFRWWLLWLSGHWLIPAAILSAIAFQVLHGYSRIWFYFVFGLVLTIMMLYWGIWPSLVAHLTYSLSGALYVWRQCRSHHVSIPCPGDH